MPKSDIAPSQQWDVNNYIAQSKKLNKQNNQELESFKKKTEAYKRISSTLDEYESQGLDVSAYRKKLDEKVPELSFGEKLGVVGRNIGQDYINTVSKAFGGTPQSTHTQRMDEAKQEREEVINPISTIASEVALDPGTYVPIPFVGGKTRLAQFGKNAVVGSGASGALYTAKEYGDDDYKPIDSLLAAGFGGVLNGTIAAALGRKIPQTTKEAIAKKTVKETEPVADEALQENFIDDDKIAAKLKKQYFGEKVNNNKPLNDVQESIFGFDKNSTIKDETPIDTYNRLKNDYETSPSEKVQLKKDAEEYIKQTNPNFELVGEPKDITNNKIYVPIDQEIKQSANINNDNPTYAYLKVLKNKHPEMFKSDKDVFKFINDVKNNPTHFAQGNKPDNKLLVNQTNNKTNTLGINTAADDYNLVVNANKKSRPNELRKLVNKQLEGSTLDSSNPSFKLGHSGFAETSPNMDYKSGSIASNTESITKPILKSQDTKLYASPTISGGAVGGLESEFNQKDYNNDGKHTAIDTLIGSLIGAVGVNAAKKLMPTLFKDENLNSDEIIGMLYPKGRPNFKTVGKAKTVYDKHNNPKFQQVKVDKNIYANLNKLSNKRIEDLDKNIKFYDTPEKIQFLINKALGNPTHKIPASKTNYDLIINTNHRKNPSIIVDSNGKQKDWVKSAHYLRDNQIDSKVKKADSSLMVATQSASSEVNPPLSNKSIAKDIKKSQDVKLNASPTLSGAAVGATVGATNDIDQDGKITYKDLLYGTLAGAGGTKLAIKATDNIQSAKALTTIKKIINTDFVDAFIGHKIYAKKDYMNLREKMISSKNSKMEDFVQLHEQLKLLSDDTRASIHKYISGDRNVKLSDSLKSFSDNYILEIEKQGKELVDLGILDKAQYEKFQGRYLHRVYEKDLTKNVSQSFSKGKTIPGVFTRGKEWTGTKAEYEKLLKDEKIGDFFQGKIEARKLNNGQYKFKQDWTPEQREKWGEIQDIAYTLPETLMRMSEMAEHGKMLSSLAKQNKYLSDEAIDGFVQLNGNRYGALKGKYVPKDIADDISEFNRSLFGEEDGAIFSKEVKDAFATLSTFWKKSHTVYNPTAHINNLMSNVTMQFMEGINPHKAIKNATKGALAHRKLGEFRRLTAKTLVGLTKDETEQLKKLTLDDDLQLYIKAEKSGLFGRSKLNDILGQYVAPTTKKSKVPSTLKKINEVASNYYQGEDNIMRFSLLKSLIDKGKTFDDAIKQVNNTIPDYTKPMSMVARFGRKSMLTPFISWTYYSTPIILRQFKERPERALAILGAMYGINKAFGIDPYDKKEIPQKNFAMKRIPIYKDGKEVTTLKVDRWMPHNEILSPHDFISNLPPARWGAWQGASDVILNRNNYYGGKITYNDGVRKAYDIGKYATQQITPDAIDKVWNATESAILSKNKRKKHPVIQPRSTVQELLNMVGLNLMSYDKQAQRRKVINEGVE